MTSSEGQNFGGGS
ncbi:unnamed protein product, partial [Cuscuta epithymum]